MKTTGIIGVAAALIVLVAITGSVMADQNVCATPETQGITTSETVVVTGTMSSSEALGWTLSSANAISANWGQVAAGQSQYSTGYTESTVAGSGSTTFIKTFAVDTANRLLNQKNVQTYRQVQYVSAGAGEQMTSNEEIFVDGMADNDTMANTMLCPFATSQFGVAPAHCNIVTAGSNLQLTQGNFVTNANDRFVNVNADVPVTLHYDVSLKGFPDDKGAFTIPAVGSAAAYLKAHIMESRGGVDANGVPVRASDLTYSETTKASGYITTFNKNMDYQSGFRRI